MILVVGATGVLGAEVCRQLRLAGHAVRGLVRPGSSREPHLRALGVEIAHGDLRMPDTLGAAVRGVSAVVTTATAMSSTTRGTSLRAVDRDGQLALVSAAARAGTANFVYVSISPNYRERAPLMRYKRTVERAVRTSGMRWTVLQPSNFMEIWLGPALGWDLVRGRAMIFGDGTAPVSWISVHDVAAVCALAVTESSTADRDVPLGGPEALAPNAVLATFESLAQRRFKVTRIPAPLLAALVPVVALVNERQASGMSLGAQAGAAGDVIESAVQRTLPVRWTTIREYATRALQE